MIVHLLKERKQDKVVAKCGVTGKAKELGERFTVWSYDVSCSACGGVARRIQSGQRG